MSTKKDYHIDVMCNVCEKIMRDDNLKRHVNAKHAKTLNSIVRAEARDLKTLPAFAENVEATTDESKNDCN